MRSRPYAALVFSLFLAAACGCERAPQTGDADAARARVQAVRERATTPPAREWRSYLGDEARTHASPLAQIDRENVHQLEEAWRYASGAVAPDAATEIQFNPLIVDGVLYGISPELRIFALDAATGEELWTFDPGAAVEIWTRARGAVWWEGTDASGGRIERLFVGTGPFLWALDPLTGHPVAEFGTDGRIDLREGLGRDLDDDMMQVVLTTPPAVFEDLLITGGRVNELRGAAPGHVRAFDARTGEQRWIFRTIPAPGEVGAETWPPGAIDVEGGANAWAGMSVDAERGLVFVPTGSAAGDFHGGKRAGDNLFANSLLALDARTGERRWHYQFVRHDLWDRDLPAPPNLLELARDGERIPAVAQVTKTGHVFVFHRETGEPLFPIGEAEVKGDALAGEHPPASQPVPLAPPPFVRQAYTEELLPQRSEAERGHAAGRLESLIYGDPWDLPSEAGTVFYPGIDGGAEWGGAAWDPVRRLLIVNGNQVPWVIRMILAEEGFDPTTTLAGGYLLACGGCHGADMRGDGTSVPSLVDISERLSPWELYRLIRDGRGRMPGYGASIPSWQLALLTGWVWLADEDDAPSNLAADAGGGEFVHAGYQKLVGLDGLPAVAPPWGTLTALDLDAGEIRWQVPLGDYPEARALGYAGLGAENYGGPVVTAGGLTFIAATPDAKLRVFDTETGTLLRELDLPAGGFATPAVYEADGRSFVVVAAGGGKLGQSSADQWVAFSLGGRSD